MSLDNMIIVITGASRGLGAALVEQCRAAGATVVGCSSSGSGDLHQVDVTDADAVQEFIAAVQAEHGHIDVLINNAGTVGELAPVEQTTDADWYTQMNTNVNGVYHCLKAVLPALKEQNNGTVITIGSKAAKHAHPHLAAYSVSKAAVRSLSQAVAKDLAESSVDVRCLLVNPGGINTDMRSGLFGEEDASQQQSPEAVAEIIVGMIADGQGFPNGSEVEVVEGEITEVGSLV